MYCVSQYTIKISTTLQAFIVFYNVTPHRPIFKRRYKRLLRRIRYVNEMKRYKNKREEEKCVVKPLENFDRDNMLHIRFMCFILCNVVVDISAKSGTYLCSCPWTKHFLPYLCGSFSISHRLFPLLFVSLFFSCNVPRNVQMFYAN